MKQVQVGVVVATLSIIALVVYGAFMLYYAGQALRQSMGQALLVLLLPFYLHYFASLRSSHGAAMRWAPTLALTLALLLGG